MRFTYFFVVALLSAVSTASILERLQERVNNECTTIMDLFIVLDSSGSIGAPAFEQAKSSLVDLVSKLEIGPKKVQVWVINYGDDVQIPVNFLSMPLSEFTKLNLIRRIKDIPYLNGRCTATGDALNEARQLCNRGCRGIHEGAARIVLVLTDGNSNCGTAVDVQSALLGSSTRASVFAVGIGYGINNAELLSIATERKYVVHVADYLQLATAINNITVQACGIPAFVVTNIKIQSEVTINNSRYYQLDTTEFLRQNINSQGGFIEIIIHVIDGAVEVYTSTTDSNPGPDSGHHVSFETRGSDQYYIEHIEQKTSRLYFSFFGVRAKNEYDFIVQWLDMSGSIIG